MKSVKNTLLLPLLTVALLAPSAVRADETNHWHFDTSLNLFLAGLSGDVAMRGQPAHVGASFGTIFDHLKGAAAGTVAAGYGRWSLATEFSYLELGATTAPADVELKQWLVEPSLRYKFCDYMEGLAGARYNNLDGTINFHGPLGRVGGGTQEWWDPIVGAQLSFPLIGRKLTFDGRFDVGGFGVGSDLTWQVFPFLNWRFAQWASAQLGYRWLGTDYETGSGASRFRYDVVAQGPQIGVTFHF